VISPKISYLDKSLGHIRDRFGTDSGLMWDRCGTDMGRPAGRPSNKILDFIFDFIILTNDALFKTNA